MSVKERRRVNVFSRRNLIVASLQGMCTAAIAYRYYDLQFNRAEEFQLSSEDNRIKSQLISPERGFLLDRYGEKLAYNVPFFSVFITADKTEDYEQSLLRLANIINLDDQAIISAAEKIASRPSFIPVLISENISIEHAMIINTRLPELPGVEVIDTSFRFYPKREISAHILGYVSSVSADDIKSDQDPSLRHPNFKIGRSGIEYILDSQLRGKAGYKRIEVNAHGRPIRLIQSTPPQQGMPSVLTISSRLQDLTYRQLAKHKSGSALVMDVQTGAVLCCASYPSYDPNSFVRGLGQEEWAKLSQNDLAPLTNKALAGQYPPGSTFKMVTMLAALEAGITPRYSCNCTGFLEVGNQRFHCWNRNGHGLTNMHDALVQSCDIWYYQISLELGIEKINATARKLGFGQALSMDLKQERAGLLPTKEWKKERTGIEWTLGDTVQSSIGQGFNLATGLQLATMTARIASGKKVYPYFLHRQNTPNIDLLDIPQSYLELTRKAMYDVLYSSEGTAHGASINDARVTMAGKTGTAQVRRITREERENGQLTDDEIAWRERDHALFCGYAPFDRPKYAAAVIIDHGLSGSKAAAPLATQLLIAAMIEDQEGLPLAQSPVEPELRATRQVKRPSNSGWSSLVGEIFSF